MYRGIINDEVSSKMAALSEATGTIPAFYRELFELITIDGQSVTREIFTQLLIKSNLSSNLLSQIPVLIPITNGSLDRNAFFKALALIGWGQKGKELHQRLVEDFSNQELPAVELNNLEDLTKMVERQRNPTRLGYTYTDLCRIDSILVDIIPEKKGLFLKHVEYQIASRRLGSIVRRRYNDFLVLHELLVGRFPYRLIPKLPPKKVLVATDHHFIEERRKSLRRWMTLIARHPTLCTDPIVEFFLQHNGEDIQQKMRDTFRRLPDEFATSALAARAKELVPSERQFANSREHIKIVLSCINRLKVLADNLTTRTQNYAIDMADLATQLTSLAGADDPSSASFTLGDQHFWTEMKKGFPKVSKELGRLSFRANGIAVRTENELSDRLQLLLEILHAHGELCERHERGVAHDHARALSRLLSLKKRQMQGVIRGSDSESAEQLEKRATEQEHVIANIELRYAFSLHCLHLETQLVHTHLELLASFLTSLVTVERKGHLELAEVWSLIEPTVLNSIPEKTRNNLSE